MKTTKLSPRKSKPDQIINLNTDNRSTDNYWILLNEDHVTVCEQTTGENAKNSIEIDREQFNKLIDWYNREQKLTK